LALLNFYRENKHGYLRNQVSTLLPQPVYVVWNMVQATSECYLVTLELSPMSCEQFASAFVTELRVLFLIKQHDT